MSNNETPADVIREAAGQNWRRRLGSESAASNLTVRDYFAAHAPAPPEWWLRCYVQEQDLDTDAGTYAQWSFCYAEAMVKARPR